MAFDGNEITFPTLTPTLQMVYVSRHRRFRTRDEPGWMSKDVSREAIEECLSYFGQTFYEIAQPKQEATSKRSIRFERKGERIPTSINSLDGTIEVVTFRRDEEVMTLTWLN